MPEASDYIGGNRAAWTLANAKYTAAKARDSWNAERITWGVFSIPEDELHVLPDMNGRDVIELGCGTAYFGAWLKKHGAHRVVGIDITPAQLETARAMNAELGLGLEFIEANAEAVPLPDASFDLAFSEYGASIWCDPYLWIPEAARLLRRGGELIFLRNSDIQMACAPDEGNVGERLVRPLKGMHRLDWADDGTTEFHLNVSDLFQLVRKTGFEVVDYRELFAAPGATDHPYYSYVPADWAKRWPIEEIWRARKQ